MGGWRLFGGRWPGSGGMDDLVSDHRVRDLMSGGA
jgi:hypothetical protein